jgi:HlyD family secretion protein
MKKKRRKWVTPVIVLLVLALLGGGAYWFYRSRAANSEGTAYVQSVAAITGRGSVGSKAQYNGIVEAKNVIEINPSGEMRVAECFVTAGMKVNEGDLLFRYDAEDLKLSHAQLLIDITGLENELRTKREQLESLNKQLAKAKEKDRYALELEIETVDLEIRRKEFELKDKQQKADEMQSLIDASEVCSPVTGTVRSVRDDSGSGDPFGYSGGESSAYITIIAGTDFCVKGTVSEQTVYTLYPGMPVLIRSRVDDTVYAGTIYRVDTDSTVGGQDYYSGGGERASKYAFYVEPESVEGLLIGQHVLIDLNVGEAETGALMLPAAFLIEEDGAFFVWAADAKDRIEKRSVTVGAYSAETESYEITAGLTYKDRIAFPDETVHAGMTASETAYVDPAQNGGFDDGGFENGGFENGGFDDGGFENGGFDDGVTPAFGTDEVPPGEPVEDVIVPEDGFGG